MSPIDPRDVARADEARRRAEALARLQQQAPAVPAPPPGAPSHERTPPVDVVEKMPATLIGGETVRPDRARLDLELDRQQLAAAFAAAAPPLPAGVRAASPAVASRPPVVVPPGAAWARATSAVLGTSVAWLAEKARWLEGRASQVRRALPAFRLREQPLRRRNRAGVAGRLSRAKADAESALMGDIAAGQSLLGTARDISNQHRSREEMARGQKSSEGAIKERTRVAAVADDEASPTLLRTAARTATDLLDRANAKFQAAVLAAGGDADEIAAARKAYEATRKTVVDTMDRAGRALAAAPPVGDPPAADPNATAAPPIAETRDSEASSSSQMRRH